MYRIPDPKDMVLEIIDVPPGFYVYEEEPWDNQSAARAWPDQQTWLKNFESWGRLGGFEATFETGQMKELILSSAAIFRTNEGAHEAFWAMRVGLEHTLGNRYSARDRSLTLLEEVVRPKTDKDTFIIHVNASVTAFDTPVTLDMVSLNFLREEVICTIVWRSFQADVPEGRLTDLATKQDLRVRDSLHGPV